MANPFGDNGMFQPEALYGDVQKATQLASEAPISGAPIPGASTTTRPATPSGPAPVPAGPMAIPFAPAPSGVEYYQRLSATWRALAATPGASDNVKAMAKAAKQRLNAMHRINSGAG